MCGHLKRVKRFRQLVLDSQVDINSVQDSFGRTPLLLLCSTNNSDRLWLYVRILLKRSDLLINAKDKKGTNALLTVCFHYSGKNLFEVVKLLLKRGIDIKARNEFGCNALISLLRNPNLEFSHLLEIVQLLLDGGLNVNVKANDGSSSLTTLVFLAGHMHSHFEEILAIMKLLIESNIRVNTKWKKGRNALMIACEKCHPKKNMLLEVVQLLVSSGSDVNIVDEDGLTAFDIIKKRGLPEDCVAAIQVCFTQSFL